MPKVIIKRHGEEEPKEIISSEKEKAIALVEQYKKQSPKKYETKKVALENWIKSIK